MHSALLSTLHSHALVSITDSGGRITEANDAFCALSGYSPEELIGNNHRIINSGTHPKEFWKAMWRTIATGASWRGEVCNRAKDGTLYWVDSMVTRYRDERTQAVSYISIRFDITNSKAMAQRLLRDARYDKLTGLANRAQFMARLEKALQRVQSGEQPHYAVLFLDFDRFKLVNDTLGHDAGDELLRQIAARLRGHLRARDSIGDDSTGNVVSRFGGDEFLLLVNDLKSPADATRMAERLLRALAPPYDIHGSEVYSTASIGIATSEHPAQGAEEVVANADMAMYEAKRLRRGCSVAFDEQMHTRLLRQVQVESALRHALGTQELRVEYQPIVDLASGKVVSAEALVRWTHPSLGEVSPAEFVPVAEDSGLVIPLDAWVLDTACADMVRWHARNPEHAPATISVNLSRAELALGDRLLEQVQTALSRAGLPAQRLQLEITEREVMRNPATSLKLMKDLRAMGVRLAMDDFGTGTSSLALLRDFPFDTIKIDRSFLHGLGDSPELMAVIHATVTLVENLNMASLAEGVEDPAQVAILLALGCRYAQGFLFGHSVPAGELLQASRPGYSVRPVLPRTAVS
jgi:diguanylate cyclase (GGDEF)-like protein/PAS domain S-box-containing protein